MQTFEDIPVEAPPSCPTCGAAMVYKGGSFGFVHCEWMLLYRAGGWEKNGKIVKDRRLRNSGRPDERAFAPAG